jgi:hypothetical protein
VAQIELYMQGVRALENWLFSEGRGFSNGTGNYRSSSDR